MISIICGGCFSLGLKLLMRNNIPMLSFCNLTITLSIITTSIIILSYVLGFVMSNFPMRLYHFFNSLFYFITSSLLIDFLIHFDLEDFVNEMKKNVLLDWKQYYTQHSMLNVVCTLGFINSFLYAFDIYWDMRKLYNSLH